MTQAIFFHKKKLNNAPIIYRKHYKPPVFVTPKIILDVEITPHHTRVKSKLHFKKNSNVSTAFARRNKNQALILNGINLEDDFLLLNNQSHFEYQKTDSHLIIPQPPDEGILETTVSIYPQNNHALEGLYAAADVYCTQNEPEGFRRITYFVDRPDNLCVFETTITADKADYPILLAGGNLIDEGTKNKLHWKRYLDPHPKPCYLYALVAGDLDLVKDSYITQKSKRHIKLCFYVTKKNDNSKKCTHALASLKRAMKWDEDEYGLEYDLDIYNILAVENFNLGAMENKGLNIFNSKLVLASKDSATDNDYFNIESVIAHEYFHNWTGNRVTIQSWFQLTLKEGLTVFRDQQFSAHHHSQAIKRIADVRIMQTQQFQEDAGPNSHAIQPSFYREINNFYTLTVYNKGAEVVRMLYHLLGKKRYHQAIKLFIATNDGTASTVEHFLNTIEQVHKNTPQKEDGFTITERQLKKFRRWYHQNGTPIIFIKTHYRPKQKKLIITMTQAKSKHRFSKPLLHPVKSACYLPRQKKEMPLWLLLDKTKQKFIFKNVDEKPIMFFNLDFSTSAILKEQVTLADLMERQAFTNNSYLKWQLTMEIIRKLFHNYQSLYRQQKINYSATTMTSNLLASTVPKHFFEMIFNLIINTSIDNDLKSECLLFPEIYEYFQEVDEINLPFIASFQQYLATTFAVRYANEFEKQYRKYHQKINCKSSVVSNADRRWKNICLYFLSYLAEEKKSIAHIEAQLKSADNMTDEFAALKCLLHSKSRLALTATKPHQCIEKAIKQFENKWQNNSLVMDKFFTLSAQYIGHNVDANNVTAIVDALKQLEAHPAFKIHEPNKVRALFGTFIFKNPLAFYHSSNNVYPYLVQKILFIDSFNPQLAARLATGFQHYHKLLLQQKKRMMQSLVVFKQNTMSKDLAEIINNLWQKKQSYSLAHFLPNF